MFWILTLEHMLVDNCAMQIVHNPCQFDVVLTENMFGDILSDEASMVAGSIGMLSSASLNETKFGLYEPSHGSAPDIAGKNIANPIATVLSSRKCCTENLKRRIPHRRHHVRGMQKSIHLRNGRSAGKSTGVRLKKAFRKLRVPVCGRFCPNEGDVAGYVN